MEGLHLKWFHFKGLLLKGGLEGILLAGLLEELLLKGIPGELLVQVLLE